MTMAETGQIQRSNFVLAVPDVVASARYYQDVLGFTVHDMGDEGWRMLIRDSCCIMIGDCPNAIPPRELGDHSYFAYLVVADIDALHAEFQGKGAQIPCPPVTEAWGMREFSVQTPDGHRIMFGQRVSRL